MWACALFVSVVLVVPQLVGVCVLIQLTNCSVRFNFHSYASLPGKTTSVFSHFKLPCYAKVKAESELPGDKSCQKNAHQTFREEYMYRKVSVHCMISTSTQSMVECTTSNDGVNWKHHINKGKRKYIEDFPFYGL